MDRISREKKSIDLMIRLYCKHKEKNSTLCNECCGLLEYSHKRLDRCHYGNEKSTCKKCPTHCYAPLYREKIKIVMRFSGPRMFLYHPILAIKHLFNK